MTKVAFNHIEVAVHQVDSGAPNLNVNQPESLWHRHGVVSGAMC